MESKPLCGAFIGKFFRLVWQLFHPPTGSQVRRAVAAYCLVIGLGRLGIYASLVTPHLKSDIYGWAFVALAALLFATLNSRRDTLVARLVAGFGAGILAAYAVDVSGVFETMTSACILLCGAAYCLLGEAGTRHAD